MRASPAVRISATLAILVVGLIHLWLARAAFAKAGYEGFLFLASGIGGVIAAAGVFRDHRSWGWVLGGFVAGGTLLGYLVSRTTGLPGLPPARLWFSPLGIMSVMAEVVFLVLLSRSRRRGPP